MSSHAKLSTALCAARFRLETSVLLCVAGGACALRLEVKSPLFALLVGVGLFQLLRVVALWSPAQQATGLTRMQRLLGVIVASKASPPPLIAVADEVSVPVLAAEASPCAAAAEPRTAARTAVASAAVTAPTQPSSATMRAIAAALAAAKEGARAGPNVTFASIGLSSLENVGFAGELSDALGFEIDVTIVYRCPTPAELARWIDARATRDGAGVAAAAAPGGRAPERTAGAPSDAPVAVVGLACHLPGGVSSPDALWKALVEGKDHVLAKPPAHSADAGHRFPGGYLAEPCALDGAFFAIRPTEVKHIAANQRLALECVWHALEDAGIDHAAIKGTAVGVYVGAGGSPSSGGDAAANSAFTATGAATNMCANRISYALDLRGPSVVLDTACSSSLVALHAALAALRAGECELAIVAGVNVLDAAVSDTLEKAGFLSPSGKCHAFGARADGYVRAEGCGAVVLRLQSSARQRGERIYASVIGSAVNSDGKSNGLTAPNPAAQEDVLQRALASADILPSHVAYIEAHGTGTALGDPIEAAALGAVFGMGRAADAPLLPIGSAKSNFGHLEAAAGILGLIKAALVVRRTTAH